MKIVIDTNVLISAMYFGGNPRKLVRLLLKDAFDAFANEGIVTEYIESTDEFMEKYEDKLADIALPDIISKMKQIEPVADVHVCRDPDDDKFIGCALDSKSKYIVSGDKDLLSLGSHENVEIVTVADFLRDNFPDE